MDVDLVEQATVFIASLIANTFSALSGGGAGLIQFPILIFLGLGFSTALATHKVATVALGLGATLRNLRSDSLEAGFTLYLILVGLPAVLLGAWSIIQIPPDLARLLLGLLTMGLGIYSMIQPSLGTEHLPRHRDPRGMLAGGLLLAAVGFLNGSLTSGTGLFATMVLVKWFGMDYRRAIVHVMLAVGLFWNGTGALTLGFLAQIQWSWMPALIAGSLIGGYAGAHLAILKGNRFIKRSFEIVTLLVGLKLLIS